MGSNLSGKYVIAGIGSTAFGTLPGRTTVSLNVEAVRRALADAGIEKAQADGLFVKFPTSNPSIMYGHKVADALGMSPKVCLSTDQGGAANAGMVGMAAMAIEHGQCDIAIVCFADNPKSGTRSAYQRPRSDDAALTGWYGTPPSYAMLARRHMQEHGTSAEAFGEVAIACRRHGAANPNAQVRRPLTMDAYLAAPPLVAPFRRDDCCLVSDGAAAMIVMSAARAKELKVAKPIPVLGFGQGHTALEPIHRPDLTTTMARVSSEIAFGMAGLKPSDMHVAQLYDCFTVAVLMTLEDYGFCKKGQVGDFVRDGAIQIGGRLPVNTAGGLLSESGMPGMQLIIEGVRQMRGESVNQVPGASRCVVSNQGGVMHSHATLILGQ